MINAQVARQNESRAWSTGVFWGKIRDIEGTQFLPLAAHCLDVAIVFRHLVALPIIRSRFEILAKTAVLDAHCDRLAIIAALHDVGKANLGFQQKVFDPSLRTAGHIRELEPLFDYQELFQRFAAAIRLDQLQSWFQGDGLERLLLSSWSHHGRPLEFKGERTGNYFPAKKWWQAQAGRDPMAAVAEIMEWATKALPLAFSDAPPLSISAPFQHLFAGLIILADWLGSHPDWFPVEETDLQQRLSHGRDAAPKLLKAVGLDVAEIELPRAADFKERFGFSPRPLQQAIEELFVSDEASRLVILEAETGSGKTEAALNWFFRLLASGRVSGLYFALPTRVAARELYERVLKILQRWFPTPSGRPVTVLAVPGYPQVDGLPAPSFLAEANRANLWQDDEDLRRRERAWAAEHPKRFLAATVAVGTIDQALLSVVQTAHAHLRFASLTRSLLVVDEVHASDIYMGRLLEHLLRHHLEMGGYALLLSATLGSAAKRRYLKAAGGDEPPAELHRAVQVPYPALTLADGRTVAITPSFEQEKKVEFSLRPFALDFDALIEELHRPLEAGCKVLVVLNTVARANSFLRLLESKGLNSAWLFACTGIVCPHHGRFAPADRPVLDRAVSNRFGKGSSGGPVLLVGTQTLEQSLDLDADFLVTDLAPADVLLQRAGRLHRHERERPRGFESPRCLVLAPQGALDESLDGEGRAIPRYRQAGWGSIYEDVRVLELTRRLLEENPAVVLPRDNRLLVERATHPDSLAALSSDRWEKHRQEIEGGDLMKAIVAGQAVIDFSKNFGEFSFNEQGERVVTRLGADSLELPVSQRFRSPFGQVVDRLTIPGHMKPNHPDEEVRLVEERVGEVTLACGEKRYRYSRFGLEEAP